MFLKQKLVIIAMRYQQLLHQDSLRFTKAASKQAG